MTKNGVNRGNGGNAITLEVREIVPDYNKGKTVERPELPVDIDFDGASSAWLKNKKKLNDCTYKYVCVNCSITGRRCGRVPLANSDYCKAHSK
jgi:hypothetical protein